jgi:Ran GTPase-activating protein (RanGAP) involved in mRNA processing and transport
MSAKKVNSAIGDLLVQSCTTRTLDLSGRQLRQQDVQLVAKALTNNSLTTLNLTSANLNAENASSLAKALEFNDSLRWLSVDHNPLGYVGIECFTEAVKLNTTLQTLSLGNTVLNARGAALVASALWANTALTDLNLESNRIGAEGAQHLAEALSVNQTLRSLNLEGNDIGSVGAAHIAKALESNAVLQRLNLRHNAIAADGAARLGEALKLNKSLTALMLSKQDLPLELLRGTGTAAVGASTASAHTLDLTNIPLSAELDYPAVMPLLVQHKSVSKLVLSGAALCGVSPDGRGRSTLTGLIAFGRALQTGRRFAHKLLLLDLSRNYITDAAAAVLAEGLKPCTALSTLDLSCNAALQPALSMLTLDSNTQLGSRGGAALGALLADAKRSSGLRQLSINNCGLGSEGAAALAPGLAANSSLQVLHAADNSVGKTGKAAVGTALLSSSSRSKLKGFSMCAGWSIVPGQRTLSAVGTSTSSSSSSSSSSVSSRGVSPLSTDEDLLLLAGVLTPNKWIRSLQLDGNPLTAAGVAYLCQLLRRSVTIDSVSLQHCSMTAECVKPVLALMQDKPGLRIACNEGLYFDPFYILTDSLQAPTTTTFIKVDVARLNYST